jgi:hypothetical protein
MFHTRTRDVGLPNLLSLLSPVGRFWGTAKDDAEKFWKFVAKCIELDTDKKAAGSDLDEFQAHRFLEHFQESMTVQVIHRPSLVLSPLHNLVRFRSSAAFAFLKRLSLTFGGDGRVCV